MFNKFMGFLVKIGLGPSYMYILAVRGRKSGNIYQTPVNIIETDGQRYLVAPRGVTQWVRNVRAAHAITLSRGRRQEQVMATEIESNRRVPILKVYLSQYYGMVKNYFDITPQSSNDEFTEASVNHPVFRLDGP